MRRTVVATLILTACTSAPSVPTDASPTAPEVATTGVSTTLSATAIVSPSTSAAELEPEFEVEAFPVPAGSRPHDVAPAADGGVWYTAQARGALGWLDPVTGKIQADEAVTAGTDLSLSPKTNVLWLSIER